MQERHDTNVIMRILVRSFEYRRPRVWVRIRFAAATFNLGLGVLLVASSPWLGPLAWLGAVPLAGAALLFWTGSRLQSSAQVSLAEART